ncbi:hypothetical protein SDC9_99434 [bioreactor metagenome]|uniref:Uncharacterized protein n=1 Tax=bioreactor metagenome TaxID=1076179 RepID=A0A645ASX3_9ZZZZ
MHRDLPNAEKAQNMIDAVSIKIIRHFTESIFPPGVALLFYRKPIVSGKSPILPEEGKIIRRRTGLRIHIEKITRCPGIYAVAIDSDRDIALQGNPFLMSILLNFAQLLVEQILYKSIKIGNSFCIGILLDELLQFFLIVNGKLSPIGKSCRPRFIPQIAICCI